MTDTGSDGSAPVRAPGESDKQWRKRAGKYVRRHAPRSQRYFVRGRKPGGRLQRFFVPGIFVVLGLFAVLAGITLHGQLDRLHGPDSAAGTATVVDLREPVRSGRPSPIVEVRGTRVNVLQSQHGDLSGHDYHVGETIKIRYTTSGDVEAVVASSPAGAANSSRTVALSVGAGFIAAGVLWGVLYRGAVGKAYVRREVDALGGDSPTVRHFRGGTR